MAGFGVTETVNTWGDSLWNLLTFTNQITLTLLLGFALANTPPVHKALTWLAGFVNSQRTAYIAANILTSLATLISWGLGLIVAGLGARAIGQTCRKRGVKVHYPLLVASSFVGYVVWEQGLSSTVGLTVATPGHFLEDLIGIIPFGDTIGTRWNIGLIAATMLTLPFVMAMLGPAEGEIEEIPESHLAEPVEKKSLLGEEEEEVAGRRPTPAERIGNSRILMMLMAAVGLWFTYTHFVLREGGLTLDIFNLGFLSVGLLLAGSMERYVRIVVRGGQVAVPFLIQYPLYAGIAGVMAASGLAEMVVDVFVRISSPETLPFFGFLSGGALNIFIPSGGGQWAVQGPIMMGSAAELGTDFSRSAMAVALGDEWTNLIHPLALVPVLAIAEIPLRKVIGYCFVALMYTGVLFSSALLFL